MPEIPKPPKINIYHNNKTIPEDSPPFLKIERKVLTASYPDGSSSASFIHDGVIRRLMDAVGIVVHCEQSGVRCIYLRSCVRPNLLDRFPEDVNLWEIAAGLIEAGEEPLVSAVREVEEELGFKTNTSQYKPLGPYILSSPGLGSERLFLYEVEVDPSAQGKPSEDGGPLERGGIAQQVSLDTALKAAKSGFFKDTKTEVAIRRFADRWHKSC